VNRFRIRLQHPRWRRTGRPPSFPDTSNVRRRSWIAGSLLLLVLIAGYAWIAIDAPVCDGRTVQGLVVWSGATLSRQSYGKIGHRVKLDDGFEVGFSSEIPLPVGALVSYLKCQRRVSGTWYYERAAY